MNKLYLSAIFLALVAHSGFAQQVNDRPVKRQKQSVQQVAPTAPLSSGSRALLWSDDFSTPSNWVIAHAPGSFNLDWEIGVGLENTGSFPTGAITSTTAANGYAMLDSDGANNNSSTEESAYITTANPIDLSASPAVVLSFENQYRRFNPNACYVVISTNNTDWPLLTSDTAAWSADPNVFTLFGDIAVNESTDNGELINLNISSVAGGQPEVWVRFHWTGIYGYAWFVDDVSISDLPDYELILNYSFMSSTGTGEEYGRIPNSQLLSEMNVGAEVENFGSIEQTNVTVLMEVRDALDVVAFSSTAMLGDMASGATALMDEMVTLPTLNQGLYTGTFTVSSDQSDDDADPYNNVFLRTFEVNDLTFSLDGIGNHPAGYESLTSLGTASFDGGEDGLMVMTYYQVESELTAYGIQFEITAGTSVNSFVEVSVHTLADIDADNVDSPIASSDGHTVSTWDVDNGLVSVEFTTPLIMSPGGYYAAATLYSNGNSEDISVLDDLTVPQPGNASLIYIPNDAIFGNGNASAVRLSMDPTVSISELDELEGVTVFPNPTNGIVSVNTADAGSYSVEVMNALGGLLMNTTFSSSFKALDLSGLAAGVYSIRISDGKRSTVQRVTLN